MAFFGCVFCLFLSSLSGGEQPAFSDLPPTSRICVVSMLSWKWLPPSCASLLCPLAGWQQCWDPSLFLTYKQALQGSIQLQELLPGPWLSVGKKKPKNCLLQDFWFEMDPSQGSDWFYLMSTDITGKFSSVLNQLGRITALTKVAWCISRGPFVVPDLNALPLNLPG